MSKTIESAARLLAEYMEAGRDAFWELSEFECDTEVRTEIEVRALAILTTSMHPVTGDDTEETT